MSVTHSIPPPDDDAYWARVEENQRWLNELSFKEQCREEEEAQQAQQSEQEYLEWRASMQYEVVHDGERMVTKSILDEAARERLDFVRLLIRCMDAAAERRTKEEEDLATQIAELKKAREEISARLESLTAQQNATRRDTMLARLKGPVRIRPAGHRDLAKETETNQSRIDYHERRCEEEIAEVRQKFEHGRKYASASFIELRDMQTAKHEARLHNRKLSPEKVEALTVAHNRKLESIASNCRHLQWLYSQEREDEKIAEIKRRREELSWTCPDDGQAWPFRWQGRQYHRTYDNEVWLTENWEWQGYWTGYYIARGMEPHDDKVSYEIRKELNGWSM